MESLFGSLPEMLDFQKVFLETLEDGISSSSDFNTLETPSQFRVDMWLFNNLQFAWKCLWTSGFKVLFHMVAFMFEPISSGSVECYSPWFFLFPMAKDVTQTMQSRLWVCYEVALLTQSVTSVERLLLLCWILPCLVLPAMSSSPAADWELFLLNAAWASHVVRSNRVTSMKCRWL